MIDRQFTARIRFGDLTEITCIIRTNSDTLVEGGSTVMLPVDAELPADEAAQVHVVRLRWTALVPGFVVKA